MFTERPPAGVYHQRPGLRVFTDHVFRQPLRVPSGILPEMKEPSPDLLARLSGPAIPGDPNGVPVFAFHGTPGSRLQFEID